MSRNLEIATKAAQQGAEIALQYFGKSLSIERKADSSPVTIADKKTEKTIKSLILSRSPEAFFIGEETGGTMEKEEFWIIDPIDGTKSFIRGLPFWAILIAHCRNKKIDLGLCYFPVFDSLLWAETGCGTFLDNKIIHVSRIGSLDRAFIDFGGVRHPDNLGVIPLAQKVMSAKSFEETYSCFLLAQGKVDVVIDRGGKIWDVAPFKVIVEEAGGRITNLYGNEWTIYDQGYIATNGLLHDKVLAIINRTQ